MRHKIAHVSLGSLRDSTGRLLLARATMGVCLLLALFAASALLAERPPQKPDRTEKPADRSVDNRVKEIDRLWMQAIHGAQTTQTQKDNASAPNADQKAPAAQAGPESQEPAQNADRPGDAGDNKSGSARLLNPGTEPRSLFPEEEKPSFVGTLFRVLLMFLIMTGAFYAVMRYLKSRSVGGSMGDLATTLGSVALAPGKQLQVIDLAGKILVLGVSDAGVQLVTAVEDARTADRIRIWHQSRPTLPKPENLIQRWLLGFGRADLKFWHKPETRTPDFQEQLASALGPGMFSVPPDVQRPASPAAGTDPVSADAVSASPTPLSSQTARRALREEPVSGGAMDVLEQDLFGPEDELRRLLRDQKNRLEKIRENGRKKT